VFLDSPCFLIYPLFYACRYYLTIYICNSLYYNIRMHRYDNVGTGGWRRKPCFLIHHVS
jgi:hypothetical protein